MSGTLIVSSNGQPSVHAGDWACSRCGKRAGAVYVDAGARGYCYLCLIRRPAEPRGPVRRTTPAGPSPHGADSVCAAPPVRSVGSESGFQP